MKVSSLKNTLFILLLTFFTIESYAQTPPATPPELDAVLNDSIYCVGTEKYIVESFSLTHDQAIDGIFVQISSGYVNGQDELNYIGTNPAITALWDTTAGKLTLSIASATTNYQIFIDAISEVVYTNSNANPSGTKEFSITIDEANYLPSTQHFYEYIPSIGITWQEARDEALTKNHYGLQGYLATITSPEEAQLSGEQAAGAGWIGGSDSQTENVWRWVTGPEGLENGGIGRQFWQGQGSSAGGRNTAPDNYSNWNGTVEPNDSFGEDYAHIVHPNLGGARRGTWNDLALTGDPDPNSFYHPQGYIVEYGGMPGEPTLNISASTKIRIAEITFTTGYTICGSGTAELAAVSNTGIVNWYATPTSSTSLFEGAIFLTPNLSSTTIYYAAPSDCSKVRVPVQVTVNALPTIPTITDATICESGTATISATPSGGIINWYASLTGNDFLATGNSFTTPTISTTTIYYAEAFENNCTSATRTPVTVTVNQIPAPVAPATQFFCESDNALVGSIAITGTVITWYDVNSGGLPIDPNTLLTSGFYYASETINGCEGSARTMVEVTVYENVVALPPSSIPTLQRCDNSLDGDDTNGFVIFDLTLNETILLNGKNAADFSFLYFEDSSYTIPIATPTAFENTTASNQTIYIQISNNAYITCTTDTQIELEVVSLPEIVDTIQFKNCDEDGNPDGFTDFNLTEADAIITMNNPSLTVTYYLSTTDAETATNPVNPTPFNNSVADTVYGRVANAFGCIRIATVNLEVSTTQFPPGYVYDLTTCENDTDNDGIASFNLTIASAELLNQLPAGQNLSISYYRTIEDAQLELNEIIPQNDYRNETPYNQTLIIRVENDDNGDCYDIGPFVTLTVNERPYFEVQPEGTVCLNNPPLVLEILNSNGTYNYEWTDPIGTVISNSETAEAFIGGVYSVRAFSSDGCESFTETITVTESELAQVSMSDITIVDDSENNSISIDDSNLGLGEYEYALNDPFGFYQDEPYFDQVPSGVHTIYIRDKNGCGITSIEVSVIGFPRFFTPNNDGQNDTWQVRGVSADFYPESLIYIFDRFGKLLVKIDPTGDGWDGFYNGIMLPATDYWYTVQLVDKNNNSRERRGHFSLIRR